MNNTSWSVAVVELTISGIVSWHAKCLACKWTGRGRTKESAALTDAKQHGKQHATGQVQA